MICAQFAPPKKLDQIKYYNNYRVLKKAKKLFVNIAKVKMDKNIYSQSMTQSQGLQALISQKFTEKWKEVLTRFNSQALTSKEFDDCNGSNDRKRESVYYVMGRMNRIVGKLLQGKMLHGSANQYFIKCFVREVSRIEGSRNQELITNLNELYQEYKKIIQTPQPFEPSINNEPQQTRMDTVNKKIKDFFQNNLTPQFSIKQKITYSVEYLKMHPILVQIILKNICMNICGLCNALYLHKPGAWAELVLCREDSGQTMVGFPKQQNIKKLLFSKNQWKQSLYSTPQIKVQQIPLQSDQTQKILKITVKLRPISQLQPRITTVKEQVKILYAKNQSNNNNSKNNNSKNDNDNDQQNSEKEKEKEKYTPFFLNTKKNDCNLRNYMQVCKSCTNMYTIMQQSCRSWNVRYSMQHNLDIEEPNGLLPGQSKGKLAILKLQNNKLITPQNSNIVFLICKKLTSQVYLKQKLEKNGVKFTLKLIDYDYLRPINKMIYIIFSNKSIDEIYKVFQQEIKSQKTNKDILAIISYKPRMKISKIPDQKIMEFKKVYQHYLISQGQSFQSIKKPKKKHILYLKFESKEQGFFAFLLVNYLDMYQDKNIYFISEKDYQQEWRKSNQQAPQTKQQNKGSHAFKKTKKYKQKK